MIGWAESHAFKRGHAKFQPSVMKIWKQLWDDVFNKSLKVWHIIFLFYIRCILHLQKGF
jgi:hypothetical protein